MPKCWTWKFAKTFNNYFCNIVVNDISDKNHSSDLMDPQRVAENPLVTEFTKFKNNSTVTLISNTVIKCSCKVFFYFIFFFFILLNETSKGIGKLCSKKTIAANGISNKVIKENKDLISFYICYNFNSSLSMFLFPTPLIYAKVRLTRKSDKKWMKQITDPLVYSQI